MYIHSAKNLKHVEKLTLTTIPLTILFFKLQRKHLQEKPSFHDTFELVQPINRLMTTIGL